ncbi:hypothetical protein [Taibaiella soli]|uniref:Peptidase M23 n=1 Tax=Taibaiella soli TaxID=1649169 RepID=A0A2W2BT17_9BACT|nr:hypothetical protein [Taibaiella soli]PZF70903.1 hypothetical protein DN068_20980 [Taibaiella soli]
MKIRKLTFKKPKLFKRLNVPYRMVFIDDESLEEVASFRLTKGSVYILFSTLFVVTILITVSILLFTPMKYYIPGYADNKARRQMIQLKKNVDSLSDLVSAQQKQAMDIRKVINGEFDGKRDTAMLSPEAIQNAAMGSILPRPEDIKKGAITNTPKTSGRRHRRH